MESVSDNALVAAWARAARLIAFSVDAQLSKVGLTQAELEILRALTDTCSMKMVDLAKASALTKSGASRAVQHLERAGWVERKGSGEDRRSMAVSVTEAGYKKFLEGSEAIQPVVQKYLLDNLSPRAARDLLYFLESVAETGEEHCEEAAEH